MTANETAAPGRVAQLVADAVEATWARLTPQRASMRDAAISAWLEGHETDAVALTRALLADIADDPATDERVRPIFTLLTRPEHQTQAVLTLFGVYPIVSAFVMAAVNPFVTDIANQAWRAHTSLPLSPDQAALARLRNAPTQLDLASEAAASGVSSERFDVLEYITGEPPGLMQLLEAFRRGYITEGELHKGVLQSRVRDEWFATVLALRYAPPSSAEAILGAVKGHLDDGTARELAAEAGLDPKHYDWMRQTAGRPPGVVELLELLNRGEINEGDVADAVRQSDIQDRWIPQILAMRRYVPPPRSIVAMLRTNAVSEDYARELLHDHGVIDRDVQLFINEAHHARSTGTKSLTVAEIEAAYLDGMIGRADAIARIVALGFSEADALLNVELVELRRQRRYYEAGVGRVHALYVGHHITAPEVSNALDQLGTQPSERDALLRLWNVERATNRRRLSLAQVQGAWRRSRMSTAEAADHLTALGYAASDVPYLLALALPPGHFPQRGVADVP